MCLPGVSRSGPQVIRDKSTWSPDVSVDIIIEPQADPVEIGGLVETGLRNNQQTDTLNILPINYPLTMGLIKASPGFKQ